MKQLINNLLTELPEPYRSKALRLRSNKELSHPTTVYADNVAQALLKGFSWREEPRFWHDIYERLKSGRIETMPIPEPEPKKVELSPNALSVLLSLRKRDCLPTSSYGRGVLRRAVRELRGKGYEIEEVKGRQFNDAGRWRTEDVFILR
jgi:hypothetical protein